jgi:hypothetical protein
MPWDHRQSVGFTRQLGGSLASDADRYEYSASDPAALAQELGIKMHLGILPLAADTTIAAPPTERLRRLDFRLDLF